MKRSYNIPAYRKKTPQTQKIKQNEKTNMQQIKEHGKITQGQTNEEIGSLPEKERIQGNDSKDDPAF